jgi:hypothetical protein
MSASPASNSFSLNLAAVKLSAANRNCPSFSLSQPRGPLQCCPAISVPLSPGCVAAQTLYRARKPSLRRHHRTVSSGLSISSSIPKGSLRWTWK